MYSGMENLTTVYERRINELTEQIREYETQIYQYKSLLQEKDYHINLLYTENQQLKVQIQNLQQSLIPNPNTPLQLNPPQDVSHITQPIQPPTAKTTTMKRQCPNCGAYGFAIREIDDKNQIISYVPRRIYAKIKHCTKCGFEF
jgi:chromosome segregation ATPase